MRQDKAGGHKGLPCRLDSAARAPAVSTPHHSPPTGFITKATVPDAGAPTSTEVGGRPDFKIGGFNQEVLRPLDKGGSIAS